MTASLSIVGFVLPPEGRGALFVLLFSITALLLIRHTSNP